MKEIHTYQRKARLMKTIKNITHKGITYINEFGTEGFVDFKKCNEG